MRRIIPLFSLFVLLLAITSCGGLPGGIEDAYNPVTLTPPPTAVPVTPTPAPDGEANVGLTFYKAWEVGDYQGMYSLLSPQSQALVDLTTFTNRYRQSLQAATVQSISVQPLGALRDENNPSQATFGVRVAWSTAVLGDIVRDHQAQLIYNDGRWGIVWDEGLILPELAGGNQLSFDFRAPARANIYDRNGVPLAFQGTAITLGVVPGRIVDEEGLLNTISPLLGQSPDDLRAKYALAQPDWFVPLGDISGETMQASYEAIAPYIDQGLITEERRTRLYDNIAPHLVGYIGAIPDYLIDDYRALGYREDARIGLTGIEGWGEKYLSGIRGGILTVIGPNGQYIETIAEAEPRQARSVYTSFEADFQKAVEEALAGAIATHPFGQAGAAVVIDVNSGRILAMASYPTYNPAIFDGSSIDAANQLQAVLNDSRNPLLNRAAQGQYPPGSTFKIVTMSAALTSGLYNFGSRYTSTGSWSRLGDNFVLTDWREGGHGTVTLQQALTVSCNTCFYDAGFNMNASDPLHFPELARGFGFDAPTNITGISDADGDIPDPEWKINTIGEGWVPGDAVNMSIGQGFVLVTPLQLVRMVAAVANGGTLYQPSVIDRIGAGAGAPEEPLPAVEVGRLPISDDVLAALQAGMFDVTTGRNGTATWVFDGLRVPVAGKTGTAQTPQPNPHAWFVGYAPAAPYTTADGTVISQPEIAVVVVVENAGEGSEVAAPIVRRLIELYYGIQPLQPLPW